ncbi:bifunctional diaminohydroxyphosphoribosylaminopyrimidine deaminase/5-amino-6-(5-phosphoribosylamino)uracil reductase RibD [uncultured Phycicoccus sp.]|uniref:bifunctional diaminohydroxyphosphoribosylaminopyrimidine deaminase/5-amino-6-(5-phosphoribosylamino)uracil reductase RibD n=1 Tax=uncultured Phycicoccus sp. TaxID=661422 RepID=UPI00262F5178|nr:bifunctional diaminohydroxyphosphoribosylaminopyrimidine deaminase/5-amino-6-(5-phosphoribosylamino)uracil reductase RibD [uncultured Phycicoccus sp.]
MDEHTALMQRALDAALLGPEADPNPRVGCVVTSRHGDVVGVGHHRGAGTAHAEVDALTQAGDAARGGTAYVTLEPCDHTGRTGPCTGALLAAGVAAVRYAVADPDPAAGGGAARLAAAGVDVAAGPLQADAERVNRTWLFARRAGRPWVTWKTASTLDGRAAAADGSSRWITGEPARADVHGLRSRCGAVLVGTGTVLADDPALTVRPEDGTTPRRQPLRVVLGQRPVPPDARVLDGAAETLVVQSHDPAEALAAVTARGVHHVLLEGGPTLAAAFLRAGLVDEVVAYLAPALLGAGAAIVGDLGITSITDALRLETRDVAVLGGDVRITARPLTTRS